MKKSSLTAVVSAVVVAAIVAMTGCNGEHGVETKESPHKKAATVQPAQEKTPAVADTTMTAEQVATEAKAKASADAAAKASLPKVEVPELEPPKPPVEGVELPKAEMPDIK